MRKMLLTILLAAIAALAWALMKNHNAGFKTIGRAEYAEVIKDTAVQLVDVRTPMEYAEGHLPGALLIDVKDSTFLEKAENLLSQESPVAVYCRSGHRSARAARQLVKAGFEVVNLKGGILAWRAEGREVVKD